MLAMLLFLTISSVFLELMAVFMWPRLAKVIIKYWWAGALLSLSLSWVLGFAFGATGLIVMTAALLSTIITLSIYSVVGLVGREFGWKVVRRWTK